MKSIFILVLRNKSEGFIKIISLYIICGLWWGDAEQENLLGLVPEELWALDHTDIGKFNSALPIKIAINQNQFSSVIQMCPTLCNPMDCSRPGFPVHHQLLELAQTHQSVMPSNYLILCCSLLLLPSIFPISVSFQISQFIASGGQIIGASASPSVLPMNVQDWFPLGLTG